MISGACTCLSRRPLLGVMRCSEGVQIVYAHDLGGMCNSHEASSVRLIAYGSAIDLDHALHSAWVRYQGD